MKEFIKRFLSPGWEALAGQAAGTVLGIGLQDWNDMRQRRQQEELQNLQIKGNKEMMDYSYAKQFDMWQKTNYSAQVEEMKKAGINPALLYGKGGGGGTTIGSPGGPGVSGGSAPQGGGEVGMGLQLGMQAAMMKAQIENIQADTEKKKVEAEKTSGVDTQEATQRIALMAQQQDNERWRMELLQIDKAIGELTKYRTEQTNDWMIKGIKSEVQTQIAEMRSKMVEANVDEATQNDKIKQIKAAAEGEALRNILTKSNIALTDKEIEAITTQMDVMLTELDQKWQHLRIAEQEMYIKSYMAKTGAAALPMQTLTSAAASILMIRNMFPDKPTGFKTVTGFGRGNNP